MTGTKAQGRGKGAWQRGEFRPLGHFHRPTYLRYRVGDPKRFKVGLNRYPFSIIGAGVVVGKWCYSVKWSEPAKYFWPDEENTHASPSTGG